MIATHLPELTDSARVLMPATATGLRKAAPAPVLFAVPSQDISVFGALSEHVRATVDERLGIMEFISRSRSVEAGLREAAIQFDLNKFTLRRWWFGFKADGWRALVPCNREGCKRDSLWTEKPQKTAPALPGDHNGAAAASKLPASASPSGAALSSAGQCAAAPKEGSANLA